MTDAERPDSLASTLSEVTAVRGGSRRRSYDMCGSRGSPSCTGSGIHVVRRVLGDAERVGSQLLSAFRNGPRKHTRGPGWLFMTGTRLERANGFCAATAGANRGPALRRIGHSSIPARVAGQFHDMTARYSTTLQPVAVLDVLLTDGNEPGS